MAFQASAQLLPIQYDTLSRSHEIILNAGGEYSATAAENALFSKFILGGAITTDIKNASFGNHKNVNRVGGAFIGGLEYRNYNVRPLKKKDWGILVKGGYHAFGGMVYSKDAFGLAFYGNERYLGDTIDLTGMNVNFTSFQKIGFGMIDPKSKSNVSINLYNIDNRIQGSLRDAQIVQAADGSSVQLTMDTEIDVKQSQKFNQGIGLGFDVDFKLPISYGKGKTAFVQLQARNLGFAYMYEKQKTYRMDTTFNYTGFEFSQIVGENSILNDSLDILDTLGVQSTENNRTILLPGYIQLGKIVDAMSEQRLQAFYGVRVYPTLIYVPYLYAGMHVKATDWLSFGVNASYGGFAKFRAGLYASMSFKNIGIGLSTEDIIGAVSSKGRGQALYLRLRCAF